MENMDPGDFIMRGFQSAKSVRQDRQTEYLHISRYVRPQHAPMWESETSTNTAPVINQLWDDTAIKACSTWGRGVNSMTHNPATEWFVGKDKIKRVNENGEAKAWYGFVSEDMRSVMDSGGLYNALLNRLYDIGAYGWGTVYTYEHDNKGNLTAEYVPAPESFFTLNRDLSCRTHWRPRMWTWQQIEDHHIDLAKCSEQVQHAKERGDVQTRFLFIHAVYTKSDAPKGVQASNHDFVGLYVEASTKKIVEQHGFFDMPYNVLCWEPVPGSMYPTGIGYNTLPEIRNLNAQRKKFDRILDNESDSPILAPNQDEGKPRAALQAGEYVYGGITGDGKRLYQPYYQGANGTRSLQEELKFSRESILESFHNQLMMMVTSHQMTAQEVASRDEKIIQAMGPFIIPMFKSLTLLCERFFHARMRKGQYDPLPAIFNADTVVQFEFTGILAKAMKKLTSSNLFAFFQESLATVGLVDPEELKSSIDSAEALRVFGDARALPAGIVFTKDQREKRRAEEEAAQQNAQAVAAAPMLAKAAKDGAEAMNAMGGAGCVQYCIGSIIAGRRRSLNRKPSSRITSNGFPTWTAPAWRICGRSAASSIRLTAAMIRFPWP